MVSSCSSLGVGLGLLQPAALVWGLPHYRFGFFTFLEEEMLFHTIVYLSEKTFRIKYLINHSLACQGLNRLLKYFMLEELDRYL